MARSAPRACAQAGCAELVFVRGASRCEAHAAERSAAAAPRPSVRERGYKGDWPAIRAAHLARQPYCVEGDRLGVVCLGTLHVDHIVPLAQGGTHDAANLQTLCASHHASKTAREDGGFGRRRVTR